MKVTKTSSYVGDSPYIDRERYVKDVDKDISTIFTALHGRIRLGSGVDGTDGENLSGQFQRYTSNAVADTEDTITHTIGAIPIGYIVLWQDKAGSFYQSPTSGTDWTSTQVYLKCNVASVTALIFLIK